MSYVVGSPMAPFGGLGVRNPEPPARCPPNASIYAAGSDWLTNEPESLAKSSIADWANIPVLPGGLVLLGRYPTKNACQLARRLLRARLLIMLFTCALRSFGLRPKAASVCSTD
jgi:hypothetical protein